MTEHSVFSWRGVSVVLLDNARSGTSADEAYVERLLGALGGLGASVSRVDPSSAFPEKLAALRASGAGVIVALGGDGTINAGATVAQELGAALLALPAGTMNLIAKDLGTPIDLELCLATLGACGQTRVDTGAVNGRVFLHSSLIGFVPVLTEVRERMREARGALDVLAEGKAFVETMLGAPELTLSLDSDRGGAVRTTRSLAVTCNTLDDPGLGGVHRRTSLTGGELGVYASRHGGSLAAIKLAVSLLAGAPRLDAEMDRGKCASLTVRSEERSLTVANDGELVELETPLSYEVRPLGLRVLTPGGAS